MAVLTVYDGCYYYCYYRVAGSAVLDTPALGVLTFVPPTGLG